MYSAFTRGHFAACLAVLLAAWPHSRVMAQAPLSLAEAQHIAVERSRQLAAQALGVAASREMGVAAAQLPDPVLSIGIDNLPVEGADRFSLTRDFMTMRRVGVTQEITSGDKRSLRAKRYELEALKGLAEQEATRAAIQRDAAIAWLDTWYAAAMAGAVAEQRLRGLQEVQGVEAEYRSGRGSQGDVFMARASLAMLDDRAAEIDRRLRTARTMLARWTGSAAERPLGDKPDLGAVGLHSHDLDEVLVRHPQIEVLARQEDIAASEARLASANKRPDWSVELAYSQRGPAFSNMVSLGVSIPLPWDQANRQDREVAAKLAAVGQAQALRDESLRQHVAEVRAMLHEWESNRTRVVRFEREIIPLVTARIDAALAAYRGGKAGLNEVMAARRGELETRLQALQLEAETARLWAQLNFLIPEYSK